MRGDRIIIGGKELDVVVAISEEDQMRGLMFIEPPVPIMVFPFKKAKVTKFWMYNTPAPLDIVFCNDGKVVSSYFGVPFSKKLIGPNRPTDLVVEFPEGSVEKYNINAGVDIKLNLSLVSLGAWYQNALKCLDRIK